MTNVLLPTPPSPPPLPASAPHSFHPAPCELTPPPTTTTPNPEQLSSYTPNQPHLDNVWPDVSGVEHPCEEEQLGNEEVDAASWDEFNLDFSTPESFLQQPSGNPLRISNPAPGLQSYKTFKYLESDLDFHLCPVPRYQTPESDTKTSQAEKSFLYREVCVFQYSPPWPSTSSGDRLSWSTSINPQSERCGAGVDERLLQCHALSDLDTLPVTPTDAAVTTSVPLFNLQVPQPSKLVGYEAVLAWEAFDSYIPSTFQRQLRSGDAVSTQSPD
ncbi:uncharacterized protein LOC141786237 [Halichoeres trimaculatus]|uniref:uncharacterized protein LOC141786237 n=1 Tax=Halichoeres trimaculatus TaxID=147232 RepID=UPI003D9DEF9F